VGLSDFDFSSFNQSPHCGLEDCGPNSFCNALLQVPVFLHLLHVFLLLLPLLFWMHDTLGGCVCRQVLFFEHRFRHAVSGHVCSMSNCMACELKFLFDILSQSLSMASNVRVLLEAWVSGRSFLLREGCHWLSNPASNCHLDGQVRSARAPNFIRALAGVSEVQALRIVQPTNIQPLMRMDRLSRFLLERVAKELAARAGAKGGQKAISCAVVPSLTPCQCRSSMAWGLKGPFPLPFP
jgi:hypothetical protein